MREMQKPVTQRRGYFVEGKFDQYQRNIPYSGWIQAFTGVINQLLTESETQLVRWKTTILAAIGSTGKVLTDVIPPLELIIGVQPELPQLGGAEAQNRFHHTLRHFVRVITQDGRPLVIFLDDIHWIDAASLKLLHVLLSDSDARYLLIIGAYRDNEVDAAHPLHAALETLRKERVRQESLTLRNLAQEDINAMIADALHCSQAACETLALAVYSKTAGNAFFTRQLLYALAEQGVLSVDVAKLRWKWDLSALKAMNITENVVEFLVQKIQKLPAATQRLLMLAACVGNQFDVTAVTIVAEKPESTLWRDMHIALQEGFIFHLAGQYKFAHDRIQQAAYSLIPADERSAVHWKIGRLLLRYIAEPEREHRIFDIINQLNKGSNQAKTPEERTTLAELNLLAGRKAKASTAYAAAREYLQRGLSLLDDQSWRAQYALTLALYHDAIEAHYLCGQYAQMSELAEIAHHQAASLLDEIPVYAIEIKAMTGQGQLLQAIRHGLSALERLGMPLPETPTDEQTWQQFHQTRALLNDITLEGIRSLPPMTAPDRLACLSILSEIGEPAYAAAPGLFILWASLMAWLCLQYGNTPLAPFAYAAYALALCASGQHITTGYELAKLAITLLDPLRAHAAKCRVFNIYGGTIQSWIEPLRNTVPILEEGIASGMETGDYTSGSYTTFALSMYAYFMGEPLIALTRRLRRNLHTIAYFRLTYLWNWVATYLAAVKRLSHEPDAPDASDAFDEANWLSNARQSSDKCGLCHYFLNKLILAYLLGEHDRTEAYAQEVRENFAGFQGTFAVPVLYFYDSLACLQRCAGAETGQRERLLAQVRENQQQLQNLAQLAPANFQHKHELVAAELAKIQGETWQAIQLYERAIRGAKEHLFIQEEALAYELAATCYLEQEMQDVARTYLINARNGYRRWQAWAKIEQLEAQYPHWLSSHATQSPNAIFTNSGELDVGSIMKAAQIISGAIELTQLLHHLMQIMLENAGAQRGCLILEKQGKWVIEAERDIAAAEGKALHALPLDAAANLAITIVNYVIRTRASLIVNDAAHESQFANDAYIRQTQPRSVLCLPLLSQSHLKGVLYLENHLTVGAFAEERVRILEMLATQAAVSLENAVYYQELKELNQSLQTEIEERQRVEVALRESEARFRVLVEHAPEVIVVFDVQQNKFIDANTNAEQLFGCPRQELLSSSPQRFYPPNQPDGRPLSESMRENNTRVLAGAEVVSERLVRALNGREQFCEVRLVRLPSAERQLIRASIIDITKRKQAEEEIRRLNAELEERVKQRTAQLEQINKELESFAYIVSHDLRAPLRNIAQLAHWFIEDYAPILDEQGKTYADLLLNRVKRMDDLINSVLEYSRIGRATSKDEPIDLSVLLREVLETLNPPAAIQIEIQSKFPRIIADKIRISQVFQNLIGNALKFLDKPDGRIVIGCVDDGAYWKFNVEDNGPGIAPQYHEKIFQVFETLQSQNNQESTGIGLSIVKKIIELYGGTVWVESLVGHGSAFYFTLPKENVK